MPSRKGQCPPARDSDLFQGTVLSCEGRSTFPKVFHLKVSYLLVWGDWLVLETGLGRLHWGETRAKVQAVA